MPSSSHDRAPIIGVLALQGDYASHARALEDAGAQPKMVRTNEELTQVDGLIIPGGESTTFVKLLEREALFAPLLKFTETQPTFGTCAGCILLAKQVLRPTQQSLGVLDATVERNAYGRQIDSDIQTATTSLPGGPLEMVFIRAPRIANVGDQVKVLAERDGDPVLIRDKNILAATFHPELSEDRRVHQYFVEMVKENLALLQVAGAC
jgi:5'-phosphate synthase pdxT subunit